MGAWSFSECSAMRFVPWSQPTQEAMSPSISHARFIQLSPIGRP